MARGIAFSLTAGVVLAALASCGPVETGGAVPHSAAAPAGLAPPPGRSAAESAARKAYYRGPRGEEF